MALFSVTDQPTPFGAFDNDEHFIQDADAMLVYVRRRLGDDVMSVELTNKQIWANFEESVLEFSKNAFYKSSIWKLFFASKNKIN